MNPRWHKVVRDYAEALIIALILAFFIRSFVVQAFKIPSGSMLETLQIGDQLLVNKFLYGIKVPFTDITVVPISDPEHGDIIVFRYPLDESKDYIKRVIGLPGDTLEMRDNVVYRNGERLDEPYLAGLPAKNFPPAHNFGPVTLPDNKYFCMGDNRENSSDSRYWGFVDRSQIVGKAWRIYWSWDGPFSIRWSRLGSLVE
ncbi:signal peptidase I [Desulfobaculum xiamenense]|uniref:Signal peptidase I n=1 Tax=Desulfobaculum xiamenense TaxID=995050 RepID=A0A846QQ23_9BACT|nr:signal peptidase I [Desulfobaculum xiamenense]NJB69277.1 signal peptidase I [Desulfobaculum xiamenense]